MKVARGDTHSRHGIFIFGRSFPTAIVVLKRDHFLFSKALYLKLNSVTLRESNIGHTQEM